MRSRCRSSSNGWTIGIILLQVLIALAAADTGFMFPPQADPGKPNISNITPRIGDEIVLEFEIGPLTTAVMVAINCSATKDAALASLTHGNPQNYMLNYGPCKYGFITRTSTTCSSRLVLNNGTCRE
jgi:hypothetical protein